MNIVTPRRRAVNLSEDPFMCFPAMHKKSSISDTKMVPILWTITLPANLHAFADCLTQLKDTYVSPSNIQTFSQFTPQARKLNLFILSAHAWSIERPKNWI